MEKILKIFIFFIAIIFFPTSVFGATLSVSPASGTFEVGERVNINVLVSSNQAVNAVSGTLSFPSIFSIESISKSSSVLNFWVAEPSFSSSARTVQFEGVALGGFSGGSGNVLTVTLRANVEGVGSITFNSGQVLANDGQGTNISSGFGGSSFVVKAKSVPEPTVTTTETPNEKPNLKKTVAPEEEVELAPAKEIQQPATLKSPEIMLSKKFGEEAVLGVSDYKNNQVLITFVSEDGTKLFVQDKTDNEGKFLTLVPQTLKRGEYKISAVVIKEDFSYTEQSNTIKLKVGSIFSDISTELKIIITIIVVVAILLAVKLAFFIIKRSITIKNVKRESDEALDIVKKSFKILRKDVVKTKGKKLELQEDLEDAEKIIEKEIKDISKKL